MNALLLALFAWTGALVAMVSDGRWAAVIASAAVAIALSPSTASLSGGPAAFVLLAAGLAATLLGSAAMWLGRRRPPSAGPGPLVPVLRAGERLFGPRSLRVIGAGLALPAASWLSLNVPVGAPTPSGEVLFPAAYVAVCGLMRLLLARTVEDLAVAACMVSLAAAAASALGVEPLPLRQEAIAAALAPLSAAGVGWLIGRHASRRAVGDES